MRNFQQKRGFKYYMQSRPVLILLAIIVILFAWKILGLVNKLQETYKDKKIEEQKISDLEQRKAQLSGDINKLNTDKGKEEVIRNNFGMVKEGEQEIVIVDDKNQTASPQPQGGFFAWLKNLFRIK
jgi:cell division protein FtsB